MNEDETDWAEVRARAPEFHDLLDAIRATSVQILSTRLSPPDVHPPHGLLHLKLGRKKYTLNLVPTDLEDGP